MLRINLEKISDHRWRIPIDKSIGMRVPGEIIASKGMIPGIESDRTPQQVANVATLPGIVGASLAMPDIHWGYGFPIGGVAAFDLDDGIISPGGVGYDINCGVSLLRSNLSAKDFKKQVPELVDALFNNVPCGVGSEGKVKLGRKDFDEVLESGAGWLEKKGLAENADLLHMEEGGVLEGGDPSLVSPRARERAQRQLGTLGSGNHFLEIQEVFEVFDEKAAVAFGLSKGQLVIMIHSGSRGLGHQVCDESLKVMQSAVRKYGLDLPDRQLACAPFKSPEGEKYFAAMKCAANFAWCNRLMMVSLVRETLLKKINSEIRLELVWDVCHNIAKVESFDYNGKKRKLCVHRKGATRSAGPGTAGLPVEYSSTGQPVIIPGDMGRASYVLAGMKDAEAITFNSTCHGAGRTMSRKAAVRATGKQNIQQLLAGRGIIVKARGKFTLNEEIPEAYKDINDVVDAVQGASISKKVAKLKPLGTIKG